MSENEIDKETLDFILKKEGHYCKMSEIEPKQLVIDLIYNIESYEDDITYFKLPDEVYVLKIMLTARKHLFIIKGNTIKGYACEFER